MPDSSPRQLQSFYAVFRSDRKLTAILPTFLPPLKFAAKSANALTVGTCFYSVSPASVLRE